MVALTILQLFRFAAFLIALEIAGPCSSVGESAALSLPYISVSPLINGEGRNIRGSQPPIDIEI
jgi:hypothetical protein